MTTRALGPLSLAGALLGGVAVVRVSAWPLVRVELPSAQAPARAAPAAVAGSIAAESIGVVATRDPFRIGRRSPAVAYDPLRLAEQLAPAPPKPALTLVGVVSGEEPAAVVEGFPGVEGSRVVRVGDVIAGLRVKQIARDRVVIAGMDTVWALKVREPWK